MTTPDNTHQNGQGRARTLAEMAADAASTRGVACPKCGCRDLLAYRTEEQRTRTIRYRRCRHCGHKVITKQPPEEILRDVNVQEEGEQAILRLRAS